MRIHGALLNSIAIIMILPFLFLNCGISKRQLSIDIIEGVPVFDLGIDVYIRSIMVVEELTKRRVWSAVNEEGKGDRTRLEARVIEYGQVYPQFEDVYGPITLEQGKSYYVQIDTPRNFFVGTFYY